MGVGAGVGVGVGVGCRRRCRCRRRGGCGRGSRSRRRRQCGRGSRGRCGRGCRTGVGVGGGVAVGAAVGVAVGVGVTVGVGVGLAPGAGTSGAPSPCGDGAACTNQSLALSFVSVALPAAPPGSRSRLEPAAGAAAAVPSTNAFVASPQPTASITAPPTSRSAIAPPVAANPPEYVASAIAAEGPGAVAEEEPLARSEHQRCRPRRLAGDRRAGRRHVDDLQPEQVGRRRPLVRDLDELVRRRGAACLYLGDDQRRRRPSDGTGQGDRSLGAGGRGDHHDDDERGEPRAPGTIHR